MKSREIKSEHALVKRLSAEAESPFESVRRNVHRWKNGSQPGPEWRDHLAKVLGGSPDDYMTVTEPDEAAIAAELAELRSRQADDRRRLEHAERQLAALRARKAADS